MSAIYSYYQTVSVRFRYILYWNLITHTNVSMCVDKCIHCWSASGMVLRGQIRYNVPFPRRWFLFCFWMKAVLYTADNNERKLVTFPDSLIDCLKAKWMFMHSYYYSRNKIVRWTLAYHRGVYSGMMGCEKSKWTLYHFNTFSLMKVHCNVILCILRATWHYVIYV